MPDSPASSLCHSSAPGLSVLILTKNEEVNLRECLQQFSALDDVVILDSFSTDRTVDIARQFPNVRVYQRVFDTEWKQRNFGLHDIEYIHPWVYICDADERVSRELLQEIHQRTGTSSNPHAAYRLRFRNQFMGQWIKRSSGYPVWIIRLVQPKLVSYEIRATNVHPIVQGTIGELEGHFDHYSFNIGLVRWFEKHNYYSTREADEGVIIRRKSLAWRELSGSDPMARRRALKNMSYFLKARAFWRFIHAYVVRGGFLDGRAGFHYCMMIAMYEYWIELKMRERQSPWKEKTEQLVQAMLTEPHS